MLGRMTMWSREKGEDRAMVDSENTEDVTVTLEVTATINKPVARHWGVRLDDPDEVKRLISDELTQRDFDPEGPIIRVAVTVPGATSSGG
jgi:hypothetical protein